MAICGRCGWQMDSAGEDCPRCSEYSSATSPVATYSTSAPHEFASLPHFERPFAAERTVWPDTGIASDLPGQHSLEQPSLEQPSLEQPSLEHPSLEHPSLEHPSLEPPAVLPRSGRWIALTAANAVLILALAGAVTFALRHGQASHTARTDRPGTTARQSSATRASASRAGPYQLVVSPAAATAPAEAAVTASLTRYFDAINSHDYLVYKRTFILALRGGISAASFSADFGTTTDASEQLRSISVIGASRVDALVTFVSRQSAAGSSASPTCTAWSMEFNLGRRGSRYLLVAQPQLVQVSDSSCA